MVRNRLRRIVAWLHRWLTEDQFEGVREFVYLDDISVRSLLASTGEGGIPTEKVEQDVRTTRKKLRGDAGASSGAAKIRGTVGTEREVQTSVEERQNFDLTQSKFTRLYKSDAINTKLSLEDVSNDSDEQDFTELRTGDLERGDILELRVNISANLLYRLYQIMEYMGDALEGEIDQETKESFKLIELSLGNSIPIVGTSIDYRVVESNDQKTIKLAANINEEEVDEVYKLKIVTLLNVDYLWTDPIHTLFNDEEFVIYCRVEHVDVDVWHPLKITRAWGSLSQEAADQLNKRILQVLEDVRNELSEIKGFGNDSNNLESSIVKDIPQYTERLSEEYDVTVTEDDQQKLLAEARANVNSSYEESSTALRKDIFNSYTHAFEDKFGLDSIAPEKRQELRLTTSTSETVLPKSSNENDDVFRIEGKAVAIYW